MKIDRSRVNSVLSIAQKPLGRWVSRAIVLTLVATGLFAVAVTSAPTASAADPCFALANPIACENQKDGTPATIWDDVDYGGNSNIEGFATDMSVNIGSSISFKVNAAASYTLDVYRLGYYRGDGARLITSLPTTPRNQPNCFTDQTLNLIDCGNWAVSATWAVPSDAISGVYLAKITLGNGGSTHIPFIVRNDASTSDVYFQTSDTTWQAYNNYGASNFGGGGNLYGGVNYESSNRAYKASYNRPFITRGWEGGRDYLFANEYPMIRFLEENGYNVSYSSGIDTSRFGNLLKNHKTFLTAGHDEYWDTVQRKNVESARDAGVNLAFFTGNDDYWKTRWEASTDPSATAYRTMTTYKETWASAKIDPSNLWTGTWRDPRFWPASDGNQPENALGGTLFMSNITDLPLTVNATEGKMRIWRNTGLSSMTGTQTTALAAHTVGYESNEDLDNGFRPAGLIQMSTVSGQVSARLTDFGSKTGPGVTTHHITLYKAGSGALVFSAGSVQWAWGLDQEHDGNGAAADPRIQQATINLLADMGAQPTTLISTLQAASKTTDTTAPTSVISSPAAGATIANGAQITVTGTATDAGGGVVGGVEVSIDGGSTWHPATGRATWSYTDTFHGQGSVAVKSRAADDSGNIETPSAGRTVNATCPCSLFGTAVPATPDAGDTADVELGAKFKPTTSGVITGVRFYKATGNTGTHTGTLWSSTGTVLATGTFGNETASGWQSMAFTTPVSVTAGTTYVVSYRAPKGHYAADTSFYSARDWVAGPLTALRSTPSSGNGVYANGGLFPTSTYTDENYYVDVNFDSASAVAPTVSSFTPRDGQKGLATTSRITATFAGPIVSGSAVVTLKNAGGTTIAGATTFDSGTQTVTFTPSADLAVSTTYTVTVTGARTASNVTMAAKSWSFATDTVATCPCSLFGTTSVPVTADAADTSPVEVGTRFTSSASGMVTGVRFYKSAANTGAHTGSLWAADGSVLATGTFANETATGWQTLTFASPVPVTAGTTYTASYFAPVGHYAADADFFATPYTSGSLTAPATNNGVFTYGNGGVAPTSTFGNGNYWVDPLFLPGSTAPTVTSTDPANAATGVGLGSSVRATFSVPVTSSSVQFTLTGPGTTSVAGTTSVSSNVATFTPSAALTAGTTYTARVAGAQNASGTTMAAPVTWTFTTASTTGCPCSLFTASQTPATLDSGDTTNVQLGVKFTPGVDGFINGVKFYKATGNTGTHTGTLWSPAGAVLASGTFSGESASGWQTLTFTTAVPVTAGTTYVASYRAPNGHYSASNNFFASAYTNGVLSAPATSNGVYQYGSANTVPASTYQASNYWVDVTFVTGSAAPAVTSTTPADGAAGVQLSAAPTATFSVPVTSTSIQFSLKTAAGVTVPGATSYSSGVATFTPTAALTASTQYTATVSGAATSGGTAMASPKTWSFTTAAPSTCPCSLFSASSTPSTADSGDTAAVQLGVRLTPSADGSITGVKFYKAAANTGTHTGTLWSAAGVALATGTFANETASGWQTLTFATPVTVTAGTTYTASYLAPSGHYSADGNYFASSYTNGPLTAPSAGGNGVYVYGTGANAPASSYEATNYWVDVVFTQAGQTADTTPPVISSVTASGTSSSGTVTWTTDEASSSSVAYGTSATALTSTATGPASVTAHSVALTGLTAGTTYYYRVTSADAAGNSATSPAAASAAASFTPVVTAGSLTQTSTADFTAGTQSATYVSPRSGGDVTLNPAAAQEFTGTTVPATWTSTPTTSGTVTVTNSVATVSGRLFRTTATYSATREIDAVATLRAVNGQWLGATDAAFAGATASWAAFHVTSGGALVAETKQGIFGTTSTTLSASLLGASHRWEIDWTGSATVYRVDGVQVASHGRGITAATYAAVYDATVDASPIDLDSLWISPWTTPGTFTSSVLDAGATVDWGVFTPTATAPTGTAITYQVRTGPNATAGSTGWSGWTAIAAGADIPGTTRYVQYQAVLSTTSTRNTAPNLSSVQIGFTA